jgi:hypothetical protein
MLPDGERLRHLANGILRHRPPERRVHLEEALLSIHAYRLWV